MIAWPLICLQATGKALVVWVSDLSRGVSVVLLDVRDKITPSRDARGSWETTCTNCFCRCDAKPCPTSVLNRNGKGVSQPVSSRREGLLRKCRVSKPSSKSWNCLYEALSRMTRSPAEALSVENAVCVRQPNHCFVLLVMPYLHPLCRFRASHVKLIFQELFLPPRQ